MAYNIYMNNKTINLKAFILRHSLPITNIDLLQQALTHKSCVSYDNHKDVQLYNERLEFIGDAILDAIISIHLFDKYPYEDEGMLSKMKSYIVSKQSLFKIAQTLQLIEIIQVKGIELQQDVFSSILANAVEAIIAVIYLDAGLESAKHFILTHFPPLIEQVENEAHEKDYKSILQHICQTEYQSKPIYILNDIFGPDHNKIFSMSVSIAHNTTEKIFGPCEEHSKKKAEQQVAKLTCETMFADKNFEKFF